ncbi:MAG TPA: AI-2E family transporter [Longimicrobiales bacterium]|nr:AI-2E family transporter [Longimicrobiales bacterium]
MKPLLDGPERRFVHAAVVLVILALLLLELREILSPLVLFAALVVVMIPYTGSQLHRLVVTTGGVLVGLWLLKAMGSLLAPFILAFGLAYVLDPVVDRMERWKLPRSVAIALLALPILGVVVALVLVGVPALAGQIENLIRRVPDAVEQVARWVEGLEAGIITVNLPLVDEQELAERLRSFSPEALVTFLEEQRAAIAERAWQGVLGVGRGLGTVFTILGYVVLTPVLTFYLLRDYDGVLDRAVGQLPRHRAERVASFGREYDRLLSRYLRGQVVVAAIVGVLTWLGLWIAGFPYSGLVGAVAGVFNVIPYLGLPVSLVPAVVIALVSGSFLANILKVAIVFGIVQVLDGNVIGPRVTGETTGLHPVWVILALAVSGFFFGFVGLLLAIPAAILVKLLVAVGMERYRNSSVYLGPEAPPPA